MGNLDATISHLAQARASAIVRTHDQDLAERALEAAVAGGFRSLEITLTTPGALDLIARFAREPGLLVGAGTVLEVDQARAVVDAGGRFLVSPVADPLVATAARELDVPLVAGAHTPTELLAAHRMGAPLQKLFPAPAGGPSWLRAVLGPLPFLRVVPTNGVDADNARAWFDAGAFGVGFAAVLFTSELMAARDFAGIQARARALVAAVQR
ncbi:MAG: bifunctional 4-hydroxy-2-oxoglutarate aldolase/2-dehydro-3-deoxy-phosphogluconate aldolase [Planctomycetota bacterium]